MSRSSLRHRYATEAELCAAFCDWSRAQGWTPYPETADFDVLLVHGDGTQIGVQAKLRYELRREADADEAADRDLVVRLFFLVLIGSFVVWLVASAVA